MEVCPHDVFDIENKKVIIKDKNSCMECGAFARNCPMFVINIEANVGCAAEIILGWLTGKEPSCGCGSADCC